MVENAQCLLQGVFVREFRILLDIRNGMAQKARAKSFLSRSRFACIYDFGKFELKPVQTGGAYRFRLGVDTAE